MNENMKKFLEQVSQDKDLANQLKEAGKDEAIAAAKELGIALTDADFEQINELSDDELDAVAGGGKCTCVLGGGGTGEDGVSKTCACILGGGGEYVGGGCRCICTGGGFGDAEK